MRRYSVYYVNRTYCDTLHESRELLKNISIWNYKRTASVIYTLLEELQVYGNRMEAGLSDLKDRDSMHAELKSLKKEIEKLESKKEELEQED